MRRLRLILILILIFPTIATALQDPYIVYGYIRYPDNSPGGQLSVVVQTPSQTKNTVSDSEGRYSVVFDNYNDSDTITVMVSGAEAYGVINSSKPASMINITVNYNDQSGSGTGVSGSGGSGGGGGGGSTGEAPANIEFREVDRKYVSKDKNVSFTFKIPENVITNVNYTPLTNAGDIAAVVEILRGTSTLVDSEPNGTIYKYMNIWVGNYGYATEDHITDCIVRFKVKKEWIYNNNVDILTIRLVRYHQDTWNVLPTYKTEEDSEYLYFEAETPGFSPFAITSSILEEVATPQHVDKTEGPEIVMPTSTPMTTSDRADYLIKGFVVLVFAILFVFIINLRRRS